MTLDEHFRAMQTQAARYLEPGPYLDLNGNRHTASYEADAFIADMIYMLDGPEQRAAQGMQLREDSRSEAEAEGLQPGPAQQDAPEPLGNPSVESPNP